MVTIAIIDRNPTLRADLWRSIKDYFKEIEILESESVTKFYRSFPQQKIDLFIFGSQLIQHSSSKSLSFITLLKGWYRQVPIVKYDEVITDGSTLLRVIAYLKAGVHGYLLIPSSTIELIECIEAVLKGKRYVCKEVLELILDDYMTENEAI